MQRPIVLTLMAGLSVLYGVLGLYTVAGVASQGAAGGQVAVIGLISALFIAFGIGAWRLQAWGWLAGVIGHVVNIVATLLALVTQPQTLAQGLVSILLSVVVILYLNSEPVKRAFSGQQGAPG